VSTARSGIPFVVAAPSGTGKTTVCRRVVEADGQIEFSVSHTTRVSRAQELDGVHYHFVGREDFEKLAAEDAFLEWAEYNGNLYGTSWQALEEPLGAGRDVLLEIEVQGARQVRQRRPDARFIFLLPPSMEALRARLQGRGTDSAAEVERRLAWAEREELGAGSRFDYAVVNDELETCVADVRSILLAERAGEVAGLRARFDPGAALARLREA
jgi:guanylate kinase